LRKESWDQEPWVVLATQAIRKTARGWGLGMESLLCQIEVNSRTPSFWQEAVSAWGEVKWDMDVTLLTDQEKFNFPLWCNRWVVNGENRNGFSDKWGRRAAGRGLVRVKDTIFEGRTGTDKEFADFYGVKNPSVELWRVLASVPEELKVEREPTEMEWGEPMTAKKLRLGMRKAPWVSSKILYDHLRTRGLPRAQMKWEGDLRWGKLWKRVWAPKVPTRWNETYYLLMHRALWVGERAARTGWALIETDCMECGTPETIEHLFWECKRAKIVREWAGTWSSLEEMLQDQRARQRRAIVTIWVTRCQDRIEKIHMEEARVKGVWEKKGKELEAAR